MEGIARLLLGVILFWAAGEKLTRPAKFVVSVRDYHLLPRRAITPVAYSILSAEALLGVALLLGLLVSVTATATALLFLVFSLAIASALARRRRVPCACFGSSGDEVSPLVLSRSLILLAVAAWLAVSSWDEPQTTFSLPALIVASCLTLPIRYAGEAALALTFLKSRATIYPTHHQRIRLLALDDDVGLLSKVD